MPEPTLSSTPPLVLAVDTCSPTMGLASDGFRLIPQVLQAAGARIEDVTLFAATTGPGSFTGLRVGLAAVKGMARARRRPICGVTTLEALAWAAEVKSAIIIPLIGGARGEIFYGIYHASAEGEARQAADNAVGKIDKVLARVIAEAKLRDGEQEGRIVFVGEGAVARREEIKAAADAAGASFGVIAPGDRLAVRWGLIEDAPPLAPVIAQGMLALSNVAEYAGAHPHYLRPSDAEIKHQA
jgi:tRNA threonylcarbamoyladenosine biosynthesis protein TsaB